MSETIYQIRVDYKTGDSFKSYDDFTVLEMEWKNIDNAKAALKRIKEHAAWYEDQNSWHRRGTPEPEWHQGSPYECTVKVMLDNGTYVEFGAPWCGYFETIYSGKIITKSDVDNDMEFNFREQY